MPLLTGLISAWELNEASGNAVDSHGSNTLTDNNTVGAGTGLVYANARDFETANSEYFSISSNSEVTTGDIDFSIEAWCKLESTGQWQIVAKDTDSPGSSRDYTLDIGTPVGGGADHFRFYINGGGSSSTQVTEIAFSPTTGVWYHIIAWHDAAADQLGISVDNATPVTTATSGAVPQTSSAQFRIGARQYSGFEGYFDGLIGPVRLWKKVLTTGERDELWNGGAGLALADFEPTTSGAGAVSISWAPAGVGASRFTGAGSASISWAPAGVGTSTSAGTGAASASWAISGVGTSTFAGAGSAAITWTPAGVGSSLAAAVGSTACSWSASGVGQSTAAALGAVSLGWSLSGVGAATFAGAGSSSATWSISGAGASTAAAVGSVAIVFGVSAASGSAIVGDGSATISWSAAAVGQSVFAGSGSSGLTLAASGVGGSIFAAVGAGSVAWAPSGAGTSTSAAGGASTATWTVSGVGSSIGITAGAGAVTFAFTVTGIAELDASDYPTVLDELNFLTTITDELNFVATKTDEFNFVMTTTEQLNFVE